MALSILNFTVGIELMQQRVIALPMPWLIRLSRTPAYQRVHLTGALLAAVGAAISHRRHPPARQLPLGVRICRSAQRQPPEPGGAGNNLKNDLTTHCQAFFAGVKNPAETQRVERVGDCSRAGLHRSDAFQQLLQEAHAM